MGILVVIPDRPERSVCVGSSSRRSSACRWCCSRACDGQGPPRLRAVDVLADRFADARVADRVADPPRASDRAAGDERTSDRDCDQGWATPKAGTPPFTEPLGIIRRTTGVKGPLVVVDMRQFVGPESPPSDKGYLLEVERWYIKLYAQDDIAFQGRFLVEARTFGRGLSAVAPYDTEGFRSPDWVGFQFDSCGPLATKSYPGLPGRWSGTPYDFVRGGAGLKIPGLPDEVLGCLAGT